MTPTHLRPDELDAPIYIAGHRGLVGSSIVDALRAEGYHNLLLRTHAELDLTDAAATRDFFLQHRPRYVIVAAAKVGGIHANRSFPADFIRENLLIETHVIHSAWEAGIEKLLLLSSSCVYPKECPQPMREDYIFTGHLDANVAPYAVAKIAGHYLCQSYRAQHGANFVTAIPANLYGIRDNFDLQTSHVLPAMIRKVHEAKQNGTRQVEIWGDGTPMREFMFNDDLAHACLHVLRHYNDAAPINIGSGEEVSIRQLAEIVRDVVGWDGEFFFNPEYPNGTPRKLMDTQKLEALGYKPRHALRDGIQRVYEAVFLQPS
jgi:GDP-L-fucose synthase